MSQHRLSHSTLREGVRVHSMHSISYHNAHCMHCMHCIHDIFFIYKWRKNDNSCDHVCEGDGAGATVNVSVHCTMGR